MLRLSLTGFLIVLGALAFGQSNDSLEQSISALEGEKRLKFLEDYAYSVTHPDDQFYWSDRLMNEAKAQNSEYFQGIALHYSALAYSAYGKEDSSILLRWRAIELFEGIEREDKMSRQLLSIGNSLANLAMYDSALSVYERAGELAKRSKDTTALTGTYTNIGTVYHELGNREKELEWLMKGLDMSREVNDSSQLATMLFNLAIFHLESGEYDKMNALLSEVKAIYTRTNNLWGLASTYTIEAHQAFEEEDYDRSLELLDMASKNYEQLGERSRIATTWMNQGEVLGKAERWDECVAKLLAAKSVFEEIGERRYVSITLNDLASAYMYLGKTNKAIDAEEKAIEIATEIGALRDLSPWYKDLAELYFKAGRLNDAYQAMIQHSIFKDTLMAMSKQDAIQEMEAKYQNEKKQLEIENLEQERKLDKAQIEKNQAQRRVMLIGLGLALIVILVVGYAFITKRRDNRIIQAQKEQVEEQRTILEVKNKEILDSIEYAKRIQNAILPPERIVKEYLQNSFILYKPKDVVAGDFYWMEHVGDEVLFAAADCTGHGVPGAMVSVICVNSLNRAVREFGLTNPAQILDKTRELVIKEFEKSEEDVKDGMDISLCALNTKTNHLTWAGAHNPLWIATSNAGHAEFIEASEQRVSILRSTQDDTLYLIELKADKQPIGKFEAASPFTSHSIQLESGDTIYIFSDGYPDQFGGDNGKKYKTGNFKKTLLRLASLSVEEQRNTLESEFESWRGDLEQVDDVCIIGVQI